MSGRAYGGGLRGEKRSLLGWNVGKWKATIVVWARKMASKSAGEKKQFSIDGHDEGRGQGRETNGDF